MERLVQWLDSKYCTSHVETGSLRHFQVCGRRFLTGPSDDFPVQVGCLIAFAFVWALWIVLTGMFVANANVLLAFVPFLALLIATCSFLHAGFTDPGMVPLLSGDVLSGSSDPAESRSDPLWCVDCHHVRELGTHHCSNCRVCVRELDHHCGVIGNCVGARNKPSFLATVIFCQSAITFGMINLVFGVVNYSRPDIGLSIAFQAAAWTVGTVELLFSVICFLYCLAFYYGLTFTTQPFSCMNGICIFLFHRKFFTPLAARRPIPTRGFFQGKCSVVESMVDLNALPSQQHGTEVDRCRLNNGNTEERRSEELPLTEV